MVLLLIPTKESVYAGGYRQLFPDDADYLGIERRSYERLAAIAIAHGAAVVDLAPQFRLATEAGRILYLRFDGHWNEAGNEVAADALEGPVRLALER